MQKLWKLFCDRSNDVAVLAGLCLCVWSATPLHAADWSQLQGNPHRSGNAPDTVLPDNPGLRAAIPLTDAVLASPVVSDGKIFAVDGAGVVFAIDAKTFEVVWKYATKGGPGNCNNVAAPAVVGKYVHVGTMAGYYYVLDRETGEVVVEIDCAEPIFSSPVAGNDRVYFATLGARVYALEPAGKVVWTWDFVKEVVGFEGDRWKGEDWLAFRGDRVNWKDHFVCSRDICLLDKTVVMPAGGRTVFLEDAGDKPRLRVVGEIPNYVGSEYPATFGQSADDDGNVYVQWHRRDNAGRVEILKLNGDTVETSVVPGTETSIDQYGLLSFSAVTVRDGAVYRVRPEQDAGLCRHRIGQERPEVLNAPGGISPPVLTREHAVYAGLDGKVHLVPLNEGEPRVLETAFGAPISAPLAVADGSIYVGCEDGYLYVFGSDGQAT
ncbi:MAG TPA: PQQ-binding-like beta-propeller repeat protein, partial [Planctomycetaceae bacterium]|nr:PQQ-binding-like beta-propeller repeat protein [Planctomycetaceae bacterium]